MFVIGRATYSANAPSRPTPRPTVLAHRWRRPARQWRGAAPGEAVAAAATRHVALAADDLPGLEVGDVAADLDDLADELVTDDERRLDRPRRPRIPRLDVEIGAADAGLADPDQHVVDPVVGDRDV